MVYLTCVSRTILLCLPTSPPYSLNYLRFFCFPFCRPLSSDCIHASYYCVCVCVCMLVSPIVADIPSTGDSLNLCAIRQLLFRRSRACAFLYILHLNFVIMTRHCRLINKENCCGCHHISFSEKQRFCRLINCAAMKSSHLLVFGN